jgi:hypothetical protein
MSSNNDTTGFKVDDRVVAARTTLTARRGKAGRIVFVHPENRCQYNVRFDSDGEVLPLDASELDRELMPWEQEAQGAQAALKARDRVKVVGWPEVHGQYGKVDMLVGDVADVTLDSGKQYRFALRQLMLAKEPTPHERRIANLQAVMDFLAARPVLAARIDGVRGYLSAFEKQRLTTDEIVEMRKAMDAELAAGVTSDNLRLSRRFGDVELAFVVPRSLCGELQELFVFDPRLLPPLLPGDRPDIDVGGVKFSANEIGYANDASQPWNAPRPPAVDADGHIPEQPLAADEPILDAAPPWEPEPDAAEMRDDLAAVGIISANEDVEIHRLNDAAVSAIIDGLID